VPGSNGIYDISLDNTLLYSKHKTGEFPDEDEIITRIKRVKG